MAGTIEVGILLPLHFFIGFSAKDIADTVCLAEQTVRNYISSIYRKLGVRTRTEIIRLVLNARIST